AAALAVGRRVRDGATAALDAVVRVEPVDDAPAGALVRPAPRIAGRHDRSARRPVVGAVAGEDLGTAGHGPGHLDGVLVRLRAAECEEELVDVTRQQLRELGAKPRSRLVGHEGADVRQLLGLALDRLDDPAVALARGCRHWPAG